MLYMEQWRTHKTIVCLCKLNECMLLNEMVDSRLKDMMQIFDLLSLSLLLRKFHWPHASKPRSISNCSVISVNNKVCDVLPFNAYPQMSMYNEAFSFVPFHSLMMLSNAFDLYQLNFSVFIKINLLYLPKPTNHKLVILRQYVDRDRDALYLNGIIKSSTLQCTLAILKLEQATATTFSSRFDWMNECFLLVVSFTVFRSNARYSFQVFAWHIFSSIELPHEIIRIWVEWMRAITFEILTIYILLPTHTQAFSPVVDIIRSSKMTEIVYRLPFILTVVCCVGVDECIYDDVIWTLFIGKDFMNGRHRNETCW